MLKTVKKAKLGSGKRFKELTRTLEEKGVKNPQALAAWIGRRKYGKRKFAKLSKVRRHGRVNGAIVEEHWRRIA